MKDKNNDSDMFGELIPIIAIAMIVIPLFCLLLPALVTIPLGLLYYQWVINSNERSLQGANYKKEAIELLCLYTLPFSVLGVLCSKTLMTWYLSLAQRVIGYKFARIAMNITESGNGMALYIIVFIWTIAPLILQIFLLLKNKDFVVQSKQGVILNKGQSKNLDPKHGLSLSDSRTRECILNKHQLVLGASGSGKTFSVLEPLIIDSIEKDEVLFILDPKGDQEFRNAVYSYCKHMDNEDKFRFFSLSSPDMSYKFNPLKGLSDFAAKDVLISMSDYTEPYYKKRCEIELVKAIQKYRGINPGVELTIEGVNKCLPKSEDTKGLKADLELICSSTFGQLVNDSESPSLKDYYLEDKCFFFSLDVQMFPEASVQFGRMILAIMKTLSNDIQTNFSPDERKKCTVVVDEFGSFISPNFVDFLNKARSAQMRIVMATQSLGDIDRYGESMRKQIIDSTAVKVIMQLSDPDSREWAANLIGTKQSQRKTSRVSDRGWYESKTGDSSIRDVEEYIVHPNMIKQLQTGVGIISTSIPYSVNYIAFSDRHARIRRSYNYGMSDSLSKIRFKEKVNDTDSLIF